MPTPPLSEEKCQEAVDAVAECGSIQRASEALDLNRATLEGRLREARRRGFKSDKVPPMVLKGQSILRSPDGTERARWDKTKLQGREVEDTVQLPDPKKIHKVSTLYDQQGRVQQQWVAEKPEDEAREALWREFATSLAKELPKAKPTKAPTKTAKDLLAVYPVGDHHVGLLAWGAETGGENYDLKIAEDLLASASERLIESCPPCDQALIAFLGDFLHYDSYAAVTPTHGNLLDADGRYPKMVEVGVRMIRAMIAAALTRHKRVHVIFSTGNHDLSSAAFMRILLAALYENDKRVTIDKGPGRYHYYECGKVLIGVHHGDRAKPEKLPSIMAHDRAEAWGRTKFRYWLTGHVHNGASKEFPGVIWESFGVLAPLDSYAADSGYRSAQSMKAIVLHREHGEQERHTVNPGMLEAA